MLINRRIRDLTNRTYNDLKKLYDESRGEEETAASSLPLQQAARRPLQNPGFEHSSKQQRKERAERILKYFQAFEKRCEECAKDGDLQGLHRASSVYPYGKTQTGMPFRLRFMVGIVD